MDKLKHLWPSIHIIGSKFDKNNKYAAESFTSFFYCLVDLIPDIDAKVTLSTYVNSNSPMKAVANDKTFEWTYDLHNYVNYIKSKRGSISFDKSYISLQAAYGKYSNISKLEWGNAFWFLIHYISANLTNINNDTKKNFETLLISLCYLLPCDECRSHFYNYISTHKINYDNIFLWTWECHNDINKRLNKRTAEYTILEIYKEKINDVEVIEY